MNTRRILEKSKQVTSVCRSVWKNTAQLSLLLHWLLSLSDEGHWIWGWLLVPCDLQTGAH